MYVMICCGCYSVVFSLVPACLITSYQLISVHQAGPRAVLRYSKGEASKPQVLNEEIIV